MRKLFRFKYELCNGTCYCHDEYFYDEMKDLSIQNRTVLVNLVTKAHDNLCDNPNYSFGLDMCQKTGLFIGNFVQPDRLDLFTGRTLEECITEMCNAVLVTKIPVEQGQCTFGDNGSENLAEVILSACAA